jgi:soluble lytic murein transglycosylase
MAFALACTLLFASAPLPVSAQQKTPAKPPSRSVKKQPTKSPAKAVTAASAANQAIENQLMDLARALRDDDSPAAYANLRAFADKYAMQEIGARAALALAYSDYTKARYLQAQTWIDRAGGGFPKGAPGATPALAEYVLYWKASIIRGLNKQADGLGDYEQFRRVYPNSVLTEQVVQSLAETATALNQPERALAALDAYPKTNSRPALLLRRAQAYEKMPATSGTTKPLVQAARDYQAVYFGFPLTEEARPAGERLALLVPMLGAEFPPVPLEQRVARADALFDVHHWREARSDYEALPIQRDATTSPLAARVRVHIAQCRVEMGAPVGVLADLDVADPEADAERLYLLSLAYRSRKQEGEAIATVDHLFALHPQSHWTEEGLFTAGNILWVKLDRKNAVNYYRRVSEQFPAESNAQPAQWRVAWTAYLDRAPDAASLLEDQIRRFPTSPALADALYWLGRLNERSGNVAHARSFYLKARDRFPETYFGLLAAVRLKPAPEGIGPEPLNRAEFLEQIPAPPPLPSLAEPIPDAAAPYWARARALRSIAFDAPAEQELRAAFAETGSRRMMWEVARSAIDSGRYAVGIVAGRAAIPQPEARKLAELPPEVWKTLYPLPYESGLRKAATKNNVDPMFVAAIIRQESVFQSQAVSPAGAVGLMQVLPKTGKSLARRLKLPYSRARLMNPDYNLQLGSLYVSDLLKQFSSPEAMLAAYNAGEDRSILWQGERNFEDAAEFAEGIPFTQTREYIQIVMRNAQLYRTLYSRPIR